MSDYINRYAVLSVIDDAIANNALSYEGCVNEIMEFIAKIPSADVAPVRHGRWLAHRLDNSYTTWTCSVCGTIGIEAFHYCPNCGAKMQGDANE